MMAEDMEKQDDANVATETGAEAAADESSAEKKEEKIPHEVAGDERRPHCVRSVTVDVPIEQFDKRLSENFREVKRTITLPGFRKGKAPEGLLRRRFGKEIERETVQKIAEKIYDDVREKLDIKAVTEAELEDYHVEEGKKLSIDYVVEVLPEIEPKDYTGLEVEAEYAEREEPSMDKYLEQMAKRWSSREEKDGPIEPDDAVTVDIKVTDEHGHTMREESGNDRTFAPLKNYLPEKVVEALVGKSAGDDVQLEVEQAHGDHSHKFNYAITVKKVERVVPATIDDDFVRENFQMEGGLEEYEQKLRTSMEQEREREKRNAALKALYDKLLEKNEFEVPRSLVFRQANTLANEEAQRLSMYGIDLARVLRGNKGYYEAFMSQAERMVKVGFLVSEIAKAADIEVTDEDVDKEIEKRAEAAGRKPLAIRAQLERARKLDSLREDLKLDKTADYLLEKNAVNYVEPKEPEEKPETAEAAESGEEPESGS